MIDFILFNIYFLLKIYNLKKNPDVFYLPLIQIFFISDKYPWKSLTIFINFICIRLKVIIFI